MYLSKTFNLTPIASSNIMVGYGLVFTVHHKSMYLHNNRAVCPMICDMRLILFRVGVIPMWKCLIVFFSIFLLVGCPGLADYEYDLPNDYKLNRNSAHEIFIAPSEGWQIENEIIPAKVVELAWNSKYVIAKQLGLKYERDNSSYQVPDKSIVNYWILDTESKKRLGPFDINNFNIETKRLNINNLKLKGVESYRTDN